MNTPRSVSPPDDDWYDARDLMRSVLERAGMSHDDALAVTDEMESRRVLSAAFAATTPTFLVDPFALALGPTIHGLC